MPGEQRHRWLVKAHCQGDMALLGCFVFLPPSLWQLCPKGGGVAAAWITETPAVLSVQGHQLHQPQELWPYQRIFLASDSWKSEGLFD